DLESFISELERTIDIYAGPFLEGEDADWILEERERLHSLFIRAATELLRQYGHLERYEEAIAVARRVLATDPFRESIHRDLVILLLLNGQRGGALRQHDRWSAQLQEELGIRPMPQTLRLIEEIRSGSIFDRIESLRSCYFAREGMLSPATGGPIGPGLAVSGDPMFSRQTGEPRSAKSFRKGDVTKR